LNHQECEIPKRRRWFALSLRGMMVLVLVAGGLMGWKARRASLQRRAVARIEYLRGEVRYEWQPRSPYGGVAPGGASPPGPAWLRGILGDEYFQEVVEVTLPNLFRRSVTAAPSPDAPDDGPEMQAFHEELRRDREVKEALDGDQLACLEGLDRLESLELWMPSSMRSEGLARLGRLSSLKKLTSIHTPMGTEGLAQVAGLSRLERLSLRLELSDDASLAVLERLPELKELRIYGRPGGGTLSSGLIPDEPATTRGQVTDAWLARLGRLRSLTQLGFDDSPRITDAGLAHLRGLSRLESLDLDSSALITDSGLAHLEGLGNLKYLDFRSASGIGDEGLSHLRGLKRLERLCLSSASKVTDAGVAHLERLENLGWIELSSASKVSDAGVESLARLPGLKLLEMNVKSMTDSGLIRLGMFKNLKVLKLTGAKIKGEILDGIEAATPGIDIQAERIDDGAEAGPPSTNPGVPPFSQDPFKPG
jgi:hypothetical protein